ncbi:MAG: hypothetical protein MI673_04965, partial [Thiotrichales bacterium]|nr:hypothetical protein [Thiotrichales bacterium]
RGRAQLFEDAFETTNKLRTRTYGVNFSGPLTQGFWPDASGNLDMFVTNVNNEAFSVSSLIRTVNLNLSKPLPNDWNGRFGFFFQNTEDRTPVNADLFTRQLSLQADHAINIYGFAGYITPGIVFRTLRKGNNDSNEFNPTLALRLNRGPHAINFDYGSLVQERPVNAGGIDLGTHTVNMDYRYRKNQNIFGFEANLFGRDPQPGDTTEAYRLTAFWTYEFDKPARAVKVRTPAPQVTQGISSVSVSLAGLTPGARRVDIEKALAEKQITGGVNQSGYIVYEYPVLPDVFQRQRLGLQYIGDSLETSVLIIDFDQVGDRDTTRQVFERVREVLIRQLGGPTRTLEEGEFTADFVRAVNDQRLIRLIEWESPTGTIRFGIPRRLDGQVRMEIQHSGSLPQPSETLWSVEEIR